MNVDRDIESKSALESFKEALQIEPSKITVYDLNEVEKKLLDEYLALPKKDQKEVVRLMKAQNAAMKKETRDKEKFLVKKLKKKGKLK